MRSLFTPEVAKTIVEGIERGLSIPEVCTWSGLSENTVHGWLRRGRKEADTPYARFADDVDQARKQAASAVMDEIEFRMHLNKAVRAGSVQAMKLWWEINGQDAPDDDKAEPNPFAFLDEMYLGKLKGNGAG